MDTGAVPAILIGWGRTSTNGDIPNNLQHLNTNTVTHAICQQYWFWVNTDQICALTQAGQGACYGDSGGPLIQSSNRVQVGIVSYGASFGCAIDIPDVYVRVSSYGSWINDSISSEI